MDPRASAKWPTTDRPAASKTVSRARSRRRRRSRGQSLVEFAVVLPVFLLILSGVLDFGFLLYSRMTVINAARDGARIAISAADPTTIPSIARGQTVAAGGGLITNGDVTVSCIRPGGSCSFTSATSAAAGDSVKVVVTYTYHPFFPLLFGTTIPISSSVQMYLELQ
jgi:Flp pilus assembly protein TadG